MIRPESVSDSTICVTAVVWRRGCRLVQVFDFGAWLILRRKRDSLSSRFSDLFEVWVCLYFLDMIRCFCGASKASGARMQFRKTLTSDEF